MVEVNAAIVGLDVECHSAAAAILFSRSAEWPISTASLTRNGAETTKSFFMRTSTGYSYGSLGVSLHVAKKFTFLTVGFLYGARAETLIFVIILSPSLDTRTAVWVSTAEKFFKILLGETRNFSRQV